MKWRLPCCPQMTWHASGQQHDHLSYLNGYKKRKTVDMSGVNTLRALAISAEKVMIRIFLKILITIYTARQKGDHE